MNKIIATLFLMLFHVHFSSAQRSSKQDDRPPLIDPVSKCQLRYYYFPNLEAYYDTQKRIYYFKEDSQWITDEEIPEG